MNEAQPAIGDLLKQLRDDTTTLVRDEISLAKTEMSEKVSLFSRNAAYLIAGALTAYAGLIVILIGLGWILAEAFIQTQVNPRTANFLGMAIVGVVVGVIGLLIVMKAINAFKKETLVPHKTIDSLKHDKEFVANQIA